MSLREQDSGKYRVYKQNGEAVGRKKMGVSKAVAICTVNLNLRYPSPHPTYN